MSNKCILYHEESVSELSFELDRERNLCLGSFWTDSHDLRKQSQNSLVHFNVKPWPSC